MICNVSTLKCLNNDQTFVKNVLFFVLIKSQMFPTVFKPK